MDEWLGILILLAALGLPLLGLLALSAALIFRRELAAVLRARRLGKRGGEFVCRRCGACCRPTVLADEKTLRAMAAAAGTPREAFSRRLPLGWGVLKKGADGACVLREAAADGTVVCSVYEARPGACRRFPFPVFLGKLRGADDRCPVIREMERP